MNIVEENWEEIIQKLKIEHSLTGRFFQNVDSSTESI